MENPDWKEKMRKLSATQKTIDEAVETMTHPIPIPRNKNSKESSSATDGALQFMQENIPDIQNLLADPEMQELIQQFMESPHFNEAVSNVSTCLKSFARSKIL